MKIEDSHFHIKIGRIRGLDGNEIEKRIRQVSLKRFDLDFKLSVFYTSEEDKCFLGLENEHSIEVTRIRTPFEGFLPKIVVHFEKTELTICKIRFGLFPLLVFLFFAIAIIFNTYYSIRSWSLESDLIELILLFLGFCALSFLEVGITLRRLNRVLFK